MAKASKGPKLNESTTSKELRDFFDGLARQNTPELLFSPIQKILLFLGCEEVTATGSSIRFFHKVLIPYRNWRGGYFQVHRIHKGGDRILIRKNDFKRFLLPPIYLILENYEQLEKRT